MPPITDAAIRFMVDLYENNNTEWFDANRQRYERDLREPIKALRDELNGPVSQLVPGAPVPKISRINQDIRFHKDKPPYKEHVWIKWIEGSAELMAALSREGWTAVVAAHGRKKDDLAVWRRNLVTHADRWRAYAEAADMGVDVVAHTHDPYKKPLYDDIPDDLLELVQSRATYFVGPTRESFPPAPVSGFVTELARVLPVFLFVTVHPNELPDRLDQLGESVQPPDADIERIWAAVKS